MIMPLNDIRLNNNNNCPPFKSSILNPISDKSLIYRFHEYLIQTKLYQKYINEMVIERKTTRKKRNQSLFTVTLIFLIAVMITPIWIGKICLLMVMSIHHFIMLKKVEIINE